MTGAERAQASCTTLGREEDERRDHDVGVYVAEHPAAAGSVEVEAFETELRAAAVRGGVGHETARDTDESHRGSRARPAPESCAEVWVPRLARVENGPDRGKFVPARP